MVIMFFLSGEPLPRLIFTRMTLVLFSVYIVGSANLINVLLHGTMLSSILLLILLYTVVIFIEFRFIRKSFLYIADTIQKGWGILALIPCALLPLTLLVGRYPRHFTETPTGIMFVYLLLTVILILYSATFRYLSLLHTRQMSERNMEILELQVQNIRRENENNKVLEKQTKIIRHDMRHMLSVIASLAKNENAQAILDYIEKFTEENTILESTQYCSDPFLDTTLSHYMNQAKNMGFTLETSLSITDTLPVDPAEFAICFANALECAMNLSGDIPEKAEKKLTVRCIDEPKLMFEVAASCADSLSFDRNQLPKTENINLNLNIDSIREFCRRQDAVYSFTAENGWFTVQVAL